MSRCGTSKLSNLSWIISATSLTGRDRLRTDSFRIRAAPTSKRFAQSRYLPLNETMPTLRITPPREFGDF